MSGNTEQGMTVRTVAELLRSRTPTLGEALHLAALIAGAVAELHASGHVHGRLDVDRVLVADDGATALVGGDPTIGSTAVSRATDVRAVGRILAEVLGTEDPEVRLPAGVDELVARAERADLAASELVLQLRLLERDPVTAARRLPPPLPAARRPRSTAEALAFVVPGIERRRTGIVAGVVAGVAALGIALLLVGAPGGDGGLRPPEDRAYAAQPTRTPTASASTPAAATQPDEARSRAARLRALLGASASELPNSVPGASPSAPASRPAAQASPSRASGAARPAPRAPRTVVSARPTTSSRPHAPSSKPATSPRPSSAPRSTPASTAPATPRTTPAPTTGSGGPTARPTTAPTGVASRTPSSAPSTTEVAVTPASSAPVRG